MLNIKTQTDKQPLVQMSYAQYAKASVNFITAVSGFMLLTTTEFPCLWGAEAKETYEHNIDTQNSIAIRDQTTLQHYPSYLTQKRSLQQTPQTGTIIEGNIIGQLSVGTKITDFTIKDNYAYVTAGESGFHIIDVTNASNPITVGQYNTTGFAHQLQLVGNYTYIAYDLAGLRIVDVSDVYHPFLAGVYMMGDNAERSVTKVSIIETVAVFGSSDSSELNAIDISEPTQIFRVWFDTPGAALGVTVVGNFAYVADDTSGLQIIDISNPGNPQFVGSYALGYAYSVTVVGNFAYVADGYGLQIIDISNSTNLQLVGSYVTPSSARDVTIVGNFAYVADGYGLQIIDITNPNNPQFVGSYNTPGSAYDVTIVGNLAYVADYRSGLQIIDISNSTNPQLVGSYVTPGSAYDVTIVGNLAYVAGYRSGLQIIDVNIPSPYIGYYGLARSYRATVISNLAYVASGRSGLLQIIDVSNPGNPQFVGNYDTLGSTYDVTVVGNFAYVADDTSGLQIIDISNPANPQFVGNYDTPGYARGVAVVNNIAYVADWTGLQIIDITNPYNPLFVGSYDTPDSAMDITIVGNFAYMAGLSGLQIIDISNPASSQLIGSYDTPGSSYGVAVVGNLVYVADYSSGLQIIDVSNPGNPQFVGNYDTPGYAYSVTVVGNFAYVADGYGLQIIDISNPVNPQFVGNYNTPGRPQDVTIVGNLAYVADGNSGLLIIDLTISVQYLVGSYDTPDNAYGITIVESLAYVADDYSGLQIIDISNPVNPQFVGNYNTPGRAQDVTIVGNLAYVADGNSGLQIIDTARLPQPPSFVFNNDDDISQLFSDKKHLIYASPKKGLIIIEENALKYRGFAVSELARSVLVVDNFAYSADNNHMLIIDVSDNSNPVLIGGYSTAYEVYDIAVSGNIAYVADLHILTLLDISDKTNLTKISEYSLQGWGVKKVIVMDNFAYVSDEDNVFRIIDVSNKLNPITVGSYNTVYAQDVSIINNLAYIADDWEGLKILDITYPTNPILIGRYDTPGSSYGVAAVGNLAYVADYSSGLQIIDVSNPVNPQLVGSYNSPSYTESVTVAGNLAYVADGNSGLRIVDTSNPTRLKLIRSFNTLGYAHDVDVVNNTAYVAVGDSGLQIIDLSFQDNTFTTEGIASYMTAFDDIAYLTDTHKNLYIINITDPSNMTEISRYQLAYQTRDIEFFDNYLYVAQGIDGLEIVDVQNPHTPIEVAHNITDIGDVRNLEIENNRLYVEGSSGEVRIIELNFRTLDAPTILNNRLIVNEGDYIILTSNDLNATNNAIPDDEIEFIIEDVTNGQFEHQSERDTIINRFTQQQLINGEIRFASLSFKGIPDSTVSYRVAATNGVQSAFVDAVIDFNARPHFINNYLSLRRGETITITAKELSATDFDDNDADLRFEIFNIQHGQFTWKDGTPTLQFWQGNITQGLIQFRHVNSENSPSYQVSVRDKRMAAGNDTVRVVFDRASFTQVDNTPVITGGIIAGAAGLGLLGFGFFAVSCCINNTRSRKKQPFADYLARELKLPGVENFDSPQGKTYLDAVDAIVTALQEQGYDVMRMDAMQQKELASDIALTVKRNISGEVSCCGETNITPYALQQNATVLVSSMLKHRLHDQRNPLFEAPFEQIPLDDAPYSDNEKHTCLDNIIAPIAQCCSFSRGRTEFV